MSSSDNLSFLSNNTFFDFIYQRYEPYSSSRFKKYIERLNAMYPNGFRPKDSNVTIGRTQLTLVLKCLFETGIIDQVLLYDALVACLAFHYFMPQKNKTECDLYEAAKSLQDQVVSYADGCYHKLEALRNMVLSLDNTRLDSLYKSILLRQKRMKDNKTVQLKILNLGKQSSFTIHFVDYSPTVPHLALQPSVTLTSSTLPNAHTIVIENYNVDSGGKKKRGRSSKGSTSNKVARTEKPTEVLHQEQQIPLAENVTEAQSEDLTSINNLLEGDQDLFALIDWSNDSVFNIGPDNLVTDDENSSILDFFS
jgi:hypothetical protein